MRRVSLGLQSKVARVSWTPEADSDLQLVVNDPAVRDQLKRNAEVTLHEIEPFTSEDGRAEGFEGEVMWHRGWTHEQELRASWLPEPADDGPWNYVLFYRRAVSPAEFVVLAVRSRVQIADRIWEHIRAFEVNRGCALAWLLFVVLSRWVTVLRLVPRVQAVRTRRRWFAGLRNP